jgi:hypothetical protein
MTITQPTEIILNVIADSQEMQVRYRPNYIRGLEPTR